MREKNNRVISLFLLIYSLIGFLPGCANKAPQRNDEVNTTQDAGDQEQATANIPQDLLYNNKPIDDEIMTGLTIFNQEEDTVALDAQKKILEENDDEDFIDNDDEGWTYIGTLPHGDHVIISYCYPERGSGKFSSITVIRRRENTIKRIHAIDGGGSFFREVFCAELQDDTISYLKQMPAQDLYDLILEMYPEYAQEASKKDFPAFGDNVAWAFFKVQVTPDTTSITRQCIEIEVLDPLVDIHDQQKYAAEKKESITRMRNIPKESLPMKEALERALLLYAYEHNKFDLEKEDLKSILIETLAYARPNERTL